jgi:hypothetical protein
MDEYLTPTKLCDCNNVGLKENAREVTKGAQTPEEAAVRIFYFVRDKIPFGMDYLDAKASRTLKKGRGVCINKTNLQIALLRTAGIPARWHCVRLPKKLLKNIIPKFLYDRMPMTIVHPWCECYLSEKWVACDAVLDEALFEAMLRKGWVTEEIVPTIDWDGVTDLILCKPLIVEDVGSFPSWDDAMTGDIGKGETDMLPSGILGRLFGWVIIFPFNRRINKVRKR